MITCHRQYLEERCIQRGVSLEAAMPCVAAQDGDQWTIDPDHPAYPKAQPPEFCFAGTELKEILRRYLGIVATPDCRCNERAANMDRNGCRWVRDNIEEIVGWMREEAAARNLPFVNAVGRQLVLLALSRAESRRREGKRPIST
jgi:hypothetical protein